VKISLLGFMGAGKTTIGRLLARRLDYTFYDTDKVIEEKTGMSIKKIFSLHDEKYFRSLETEVLKQIVEQNDDIVIATGGGVVLSDQNRSFLKKNTFPILLDVSPATAYQRLKNKDRPLLDSDDVFESIVRMMTERKNVYNVFSNKIDTVEKQPGDVVKGILQMI
jgi:shikimate kinase